MTEKQESKHASHCDADTTILSLRHEVIAFVRERNWGRFYVPKNISMAITVEAGELMELFIWSRDEEWDPVTHFEGCTHELADIIIYCLCMANVLDIDVTSAVLDKIELNREKYPVEVKT